MYCIIRLTPLRETSSFQEALKEERAKLLIRLIQGKFSLSPDLSKALTDDLFRLDRETQETLFEQILAVDGFEQLEQWIADHLPLEQA